MPAWNFQGRRQWKMSNGLLGYSQRRMPVPMAVFGGDARRCCRTQISTMSDTPGQRSEPLLLRSQTIRQFLFPAEQSTNAGPAPHQLRQLCVLSLEVAGKKIEVSAPSRI